MMKIPFISGNQEFFSDIQKKLNDCQTTYSDLIFLDSRETAIEYLNTEVPELLFLDFSSPQFNAFQILEDIMADPWLLHGGIVAFSDNSQTVGQINSYRKANVIAIIPNNLIQGRLSRIMFIIENNKRIIFQRQIGEDFSTNISGSFILNNDLIEANCYANLIANFLYYSNKISLEDKSSLNMCLSELLTNAIEHGNCEISYDEKTLFLEKGNTVRQLVEEKCKDPEINRRKVTFEYTIEQIHSRISILDEGKGFNWQKRLNINAEETFGELHGRGISMANAFTSNLRFNEKGNQVCFDFLHQTNASNNTPGLFEHIEPRTIKAGETVFEQGEESNFLFFIAKGRYEVLVNGKVISQLSADDIFLGEMSFLLGDRRSATIRALCDGELIKIAKDNFIAGIKQKPHYALWLCRLLAQRLNRSNARV